MLVRPRRVQHDLFPRLVVDIVRSGSRPFHPDPTEGEEYNDQKHVQHDSDTNPHQLLPRDVEMARYDRGGVRRVAAI